MQRWVKMHRYGQTVILGPFGDEEGVEAAVTDIRRWDGVTYVEWFYKPIVKEAANS